MLPYSFFIAPRICHHGPPKSSFDVVQARAAPQPEVALPWPFLCCSLTGQDIGRLIV